MKLTSFIILTLIYLSTKSQTIGGKVLDLATNKPLPGAVAYLLDTSSIIDTLIQDPDNYYFEGVWGHKILEKSNVDSNGSFLFQVTVQKNYTLCVSHRMPYFYFGQNKIDSALSYREQFVQKIFLKKRRKFYKILHLMVSCPYDITRNQSFCPKCKLDDRVVPILFGLVIPVYDKDGNLKGEFPEEYHLGGCVVDPYCNPTKHCRRCNKDF